MKIFVRLAAVAGALALGACAGNEPILDSGSGSSAGGASSLDAGPSGVITKVGAVKVTPALNNVVQFRGSASKAFTYDHLQAVLYCRAWQHAQSNGLGGGYPLRFHKLEGANADSALVAIASIQMFEGSNTSGKSSLNQAWCGKVPRAAK
ncbi:MAG: hypothetical protein GY948_13430 [Alphaproteobacteria bacterium]|nr:hypothetical protein [Alphaproteobacteria bacterium]